MIGYRNYYDPQEVVHLQNPFGGVVLCGSLTFSGQDDGRGDGLVGGE